MEKNCKHNPNWKIIQRCLLFFSCLHLGYLFFFFFGKLCVIVSFIFLQCRCSAQQDRLVGSVAFCPQNIANTQLCTNSWAVWLKAFWTWACESLFLAVPGIGVWCIPWATNSVAWAMEDFVFLFLLYIFLCLFFFSPTQTLWVSLECTWVFIFGMEE